MAAGPWPARYSSMIVVLLACSTPQTRWTPIAPGDVRGAAQVPLLRAARALRRGAPQGGGRQAHVLPLLPQETGVSQYVVFIQGGSAGLSFWLG